MTGLFLPSLLTKPKVKASQPHQPTLPTETEFPRVGKVKHSSAPETPSVGTSWLGRIGRRNSQESAE